MSDDREDATDAATPPGRSRDALAASTLRALRAGRPGSTPPAHPAESEAGVDADEVVDPVEDTVSFEKTEPVADLDPADADEVVTPEQSPVDEPAPAEKAAPARAGRRSLLTAGFAVLAVAALVFAVVAGVTWWTAGHSDQHQLGVARDQVAADAQLAVVTVNTSDYRHPSAALSNWLTVSTGSLHSQFAQSRTAAVKLLAQARTVTKATVLADAVTALDLSKGTATVIASVNVVRLRDGKSSLVRNRFRATLMRTGGKWKLSNLAVVQGALS